MLLMGKSTIYMAMFNSELFVYQRVAMEFFVVKISSRCHVPLPCLITGGYMIWILTLNGCKACPLVNYSMCMLFQQTNADTACGFLEKTEAAHEDTTTTKTLSTRDLPMKTIGDLKQQKKWMHLNWAKLQGNEKTWHAKLWCVSTWSILSIPSKIYGHFNYIIQLGEKNSSKPSKQLGSDHGIAMNFRQFSQIFPMFFLQKRGPPAGWDCRHGPEYCHRRGDSEGARFFRVPRNAVDLGRKRPRNGNETIPICSMYGIFTNICPYMEHMGYRWSTSRLSTRSSRSSWPRMLGGTPMGRLWWKLPYESGYIMVYYSLFGFIGVHWGLLWLMLIIFMYFFARWWFP